MDTQLLSLLGVTYNEAEYICTSIFAHVMRRRTGSDRKVALISDAGFSSFLCFLVPFKAIFKSSCRLKTIHVLMCNMNILQDYPQCYCVALKGQYRHDQQGMKLE